MNVEPLREIGLTEGEIKVYLALTTLGESTTGPIVDEANVSISKVYPILDKLAKKGLASHIIKKNTKYFRAADPNRLLIYMKEKEEKLKQQERELEKIIPELEMKQLTAITQETVQVYDGLKGIQTARERTLKIMEKDDQMWVIGIATTAYDKLGGYFKDYHERRSNKEIKCNYLFNEEARSPFGEYSMEFKNSEVKFMKKELITHAWMEIYADTVTIGINKGKSFSVVIQNQEVANSFKHYAQMLWSLGNN
jgi:sugar-specific transcriptional regulator TrmB